MEHVINFINTIEPAMWQLFILLGMFIFGLICILFLVDIISEWRAK